AVVEGTGELGAADAGVAEGAAAEMLDAFGRPLAPVSDEPDGAASHAMIRAVIPAAPITASHPRVDRARCRVCAMTCLPLLCSRPRIDPRTQETAPPPSDNTNYG
ncbi:hypothetical protein GA0115240_16189, partial [Streptomyces sp. DvalAA-14]